MRIHVYTSTNRQYRKKTVTFFFFVMHCFYCSLLGPTCCGCDVRVIPNVQFYCKFIAHNPLRFTLGLLSSYQRVRLDSRNICAMSNLYGHMVWYATGIDKRAPITLQSLKWIIIQCDYYVFEHELSSVFVYCVNSMKGLFA